MIEIPTFEAWLARAHPLVAEGKTYPEVVDVCRSEYEELVDQAYAAARKAAWPFDKHPGDCCPMLERGFITVCCRDCAGTGIYPAPWLDNPEQGNKTDEGCIACKCSGKATLGLASPFRTTTTNLTRTGASTPTRSTV